jgi:DNA-binding MarR family transcriptional regulator
VSWRRPASGNTARPTGACCACAARPPRTISEIGRELGITRQAASKIVAGLRDRGYVSLSPSPTDGREKVVRLTAHALDDLTARRAAERRIESELRRELGAEAFDGLSGLLDALGARDPRRPRQPAGLWE